ncbi:MAG: FAD-dependent oxidoreductase [Actinomycetota bacterium]|nr:FAD-dependent oxidoreductase [Actinomycetota bacterium]
MTAPQPRRRRIGVYVCHCGGNISDYVDVGRVVEAVREEDDVVVAREAMFTCSEATQREIVEDIAAEELDGLVVASCSPKLHQTTFREVARRGGLNPYLYSQVNIREQCSWTHTDDRAGATEKAIRLVRAGIAKTRLSAPLEPLNVTTTRRALVVGGGVAGMRSAVALADVGIEVVLVEREDHLGGAVAGLGEMFPNQVRGDELAARLIAEIEQREAITVRTRSVLREKRGTYGNYEVAVETAGKVSRVAVGQIIVATGFVSYTPELGEYGYGMPGVVTLEEFDRLLAKSSGPLRAGGREVSSVAYLYCVGSRNEENPACSRYCCSAAVHASILAARRQPSLRQFHLHRDLRTYGRNELAFRESRRLGSLYLRFGDDDAPRISAEGEQVRVIVRDQLAAGEELALSVDLLVLVTGMRPRSNDELVNTLKLPVGRDGFFNEIHPKLRPVETIVDGVSICGACQGPKTAAEAVTSGLAAAAHAAAVLKRGVAELDPEVAIVRAEACSGCGECVSACPFAAIALLDGASPRARVDASACKGCGACVPVCPEDAIDLQGYRDVQLRAMITAMAGEVAP